MSTLEFQPVIMAAGRGSRMSDISAKIPKALLPVANLPMILYPLQMLANHGFEEVIIVVLKSQRPQIEDCLSRSSAKFDNLPRVKRLDYVVVPDDEDWGTADSLRHIKDKVKSDLLVISSDLLADVPLHQVADLHRAHSATVTALFSENQDGGPDTAAPGTKTKKKRESLNSQCDDYERILRLFSERDFVGLEETTDRLLFLSSETDFEETIDIRKSLLRRHPCMDLYTRLTDTHLYFISRSAVDLLSELKQMTSLKGEVLPYLIRLQYAKRSTQTPSHVDAHLEIMENQSNPLFSLAQELSSFGDSDINGRSPSNKIRCYAYVMKDRFCLRANTLVNYGEANRQMTKKLKTFFPKSELPLIHPSLGAIPAKTQVGPDSIIDECTALSERVSIKKSVIGSHTHLAEKVRITNSIIMDHVTINEGCNIQNSIICPNAHIGEKSEVKDSIVGSGQHVDNFSKFTNEVIMDLDQMMEF